MTFSCYYSDAKEKEDQYWIGEIQQFNENNNGFEAKVTGRGSNFYIIVGNYQYGKYISIPNWQVCSELATLEDIFWNQEQLARTLSVIDAITIATAIQHISKYLGTALE